MTRRRVRPRSSSSLSRPGRSLSLRMSLSLLFFSLSLSLSPSLSPCPTTLAVRSLPGTSLIRSRTSCFSQLDRRLRLHHNELILPCTELRTYTCASLTAPRLEALGGGLPLSSMKRGARFGRDSAAVGTRLRLHHTISRVSRSMRMDMAARESAADGKTLCSAAKETLCSVKRRGARAKMVNPSRSRERGVVSFGCSVSCLRRWDDALYRAARRDELFQLRSRTPHNEILGALPVARWKRLGVLRGHTQPRRFNYSSTREHHSSQTSSENWCRRATWMDRRHKQQSAAVAGAVGRARSRRFSARLQRVCALRLCKAAVQPLQLEGTAYRQIGGPPIRACLRRYG